MAEDPVVRCTPRCRRRPSTGHAAACPPAWSARWLFTDQRSRGELLLDEDRTSAASSRCRMVSRPGARRHHQRLGVRRRKWPRAAIGETVHLIAVIRQRHQPSPWRGLGRALLVGSATSGVELDPERGGAEPRRGQATTCSTRRRMADDARHGRRAGVLGVRPKTSARRWRTLGAVAARPPATRQVLTRSSICAPFPRPGTPSGAVEPLAATLGIGPPRPADAESGGNWAAIVPAARICQLEVAPERIPRIELHRQVSFPGARRTAGLPDRPVRPASRGPAVDPSIRRTPADPVDTPVPARSDAVADRRGRRLMQQLG